MPGIVGIVNCPKRRVAGRLRNMKPTTKMISARGSTPPLRARAAFARTRATRGTLETRVAQRAASCPSDRRSVGRTNYLLKTSQFKRICPGPSSQACTKLAPNRTRTCTRSTQRRPQHDRERARPQAQRSTCFRYSSPSYQNKLLPKEPTKHGYK